MKKDEIVKARLEDLKRRAKKTRRDIREQNYWREYKRELELKRLRELEAKFAGRRRQKSKHTEARIDFIRILKRADPQLKPQELANKAISVEHIERAQNLWGDNPDIHTKILHFFYNHKRDFS